MAVDSFIILQELSRLVQYMAKTHFTKTGSFGPSEFEGDESEAAVNAIIPEVDRL